MALRIYAIGLVQFVIVAVILQVDHRAREAARHAAVTEQHRPPPPWENDARFVRAHPPDPPGPRPPGPPPPPPFALIVGVILVVVGVSSWLTARSLARPLASLSSTTRAFGRGELDARARMERDDEIGEVARAFDDMADRIAKLLLAERELLANVSHELRTPLARIRVALDLASEADPKTALESFAEIAQDLAELERIVDDVLASARLALDAGARAAGTATLPIRAERVDPRALVERSIARFRTNHPERPFRVEMAEELPAIDADPVLVRRVIDNLLDNAHKYSDRATGAIAVRARTDGDAIAIEVADEGIGISVDDQARLFEPFFRADRSRTRTTGGLGLGLVLARRVAVAHGGTLVIESELGKGTTARVRLPIARAS